MGWLQAPDHLTAGEAVRAARSAFAQAGIQDVTVAPVARADTYDGADGTEPTPVWKARGEIAAGSVELWLARDDGTPVFLDDRSANGTAHLLDDEQFSALGHHHRNPALDRQVRRNVWLTVAAALIAALTARLATDLAGPAPSAHPDQEIP